MSGGVGLVEYGLDRAPGGIGRYTRGLRDALMAAGVGVTRLHAGTVPAADGRVGLPGAGHLPGLLTVAQVEIAAVARRRHLDLVHDPTGTAPVALVRTPRVVTIHDAIPYIHPSTSTLMDRVVHRLWLPVMAQRVDAIITVSQQARTDLVRHLGLRDDDIDVIPPGVGSEFHPLPQADVRLLLARLDITYPYVLYVGAIEARKNLPRLLEAFAILRQTSPDVRLVIAGARKWKYGPVFETLSRLQDRSAVTFTGYLEDRDLPALYSGAALFAFPSLYEGFGLPILEAMACGTPVVTSATSSMPEVAGGAALLVDPSDVGQLADAMRRILASRMLSEKLRAQGLARAGEFTWQRTAEQTIRVYQRVLGQRDHRVWARR